MWMRLSDDEVEESRREAEKQRQSFIKPTAYSAAMTVASMVCFYFAYVEHLPADAVPVARLSFYAAVLFCAFFFFFLRRQRAGALTIELTKGTLCYSCHEPSTGAVDERCECGGKLEPFGYWKWVDDPDGTTASTGDRVDPS